LIVFAIPKFLGDRHSASEIDCKSPRPPSKAVMQIVNGKLLSAGHPHNEQVGLLNEHHKHKGNKIVGWCSVNAFDLAITKAIVAPNPKLAGLASSVFAFGISPLIAFGSALVPLFSKGAEPSVHAAHDVLIILGASLATLGLNSLVKGKANRQRPCFHYGEASLTEAAEDPEEEWVSFFSGAATIAFVCFATGLCLAKLRNRSYSSGTHRYAFRGVSPMAYFGALFASLGAVLRVVGYMHWMSDVLVGAFVGFIFGYFLPPLLFKGPTIEAQDDQALATITPTAPGNPTDEWQHTLTNDYTSGSIL
jgi:membrane-associated phospholipid phosphatase